MTKLRVVSAIGLSAVVLVPVAMSAIIWSGNFLFGAMILGIWWFLVVKNRRIAKAMLLPLAAFESLPPYPNWLFIDNSGSYHFGFSSVTTSSVEALVGLFIFYTAAFYGVYVLLGFKAGRTGESQHEGNLRQVR